MTTQRVASALERAAAGSLKVTEAPMLVRDAKCNPGPDPQAGLVDIASATRGPA
ncbi:MAG: hypothetical protein GY788_28775 [bacterium]|nr:hypothetical protein [bacterium]